MTARPCCADLERRIAELERRLDAQDAVWADYAEGKAAAQQGRSGPAPRRFRGARSARPSADSPVLRVVTPGGAA